MQGGVGATRGEGKAGDESGAKDGSPGGGSGKKAGAAVLEAERARNPTGMREANGAAASAAERASTAAGREGGGV